MSWQEEISNQKTKSFLIIPSLLSLPLSTSRIHRLFSISYSDIPSIPGIRYFMIKSWNYENVLAAQRDNLWATQQHNTELLTTAFQNSRYVILLFSVNKSMAFQGYALMTTAPDPQLPKPASAGKLNWKTSPAFKLRWLGTTPVHFRRVGHLKNRMNLDERGEERAVLVGKDGQEVSEEAGMGVVWVLDEAEASEGQKVMGGRRVSG